MDNPNCFTDLQYRQLRRLLDIYWEHIDNTMDNEEYGTPHYWQSQDKKALITECMNEL